MLCTQEKLKSLLTVTNEFQVELFFVYQFQVKRMSVSESQQETLEIINVITGGISLFGILIVLIIIAVFGIFGYKKKLLKTQSNYLNKKQLLIFSSISFTKLSFYIITFIFLSDLCRMIGHLLPSPVHSNNSDVYSEISCRPGAFFKLFGSISTFCWMNITSYIVYKLLLYPH